MPQASADRPRAGLRLMHVHAHPDDESSKGAASTAKYVAEGVDVHVATCTGGERGSVLNAKMDRPEVWENITEIRREEMHRARDILGVRQDWLGFVDSGWPEGDPPPPLPEGCFALVPLEEATERLVRFIREFRPHVMTTYDERGGYPHPDHIRCHEVSVAAYQAAGDPERFPDAGEPWQPMKLYYHHGWSWAKTNALHEAMLAHDLESPYTERLEKWEREPEWDERITTRVPCGDYFGVRDQALLAHATQIDPDGMYATSCAWMEVIGYNTNLVKREDAPKSYADLLDPKWQGKMVKGHPGYSGAIMTATFVLARDLGWPYLEKLARQKIMQVQSAADPPKKILLGERAVMADGNDYNLVLLKDQGKPVEVVYPAEGAPLIIVPSGIFRSAPNPNAARLFQSFFFSAEAQQMLVDVFAHRSFHAQVKEKGEHIPLAKLKLLKADPAAVQAQSEEIKARYARIFGV